MDESTRLSREKQQRLEDLRAANPNALHVGEINSNPLIPVFYCDNMVANNVEASPSAVKPKYVIGRWLGEGQPVNIITPAPATCAQLDRAHYPAYVRGIFSGERSNGFGTTDSDVAESTLYTVGSMIAAAYEAVRNGIGAVSPSSGFHHASYSKASGYCTFNGLMVAAMEFPFGKIGILDFDAHYGDGTDNIIEMLELDNIVHCSQGSYPVINANKFLNGLARRIRSLFNDCDVVLYQAGADMHIDDPYGAGFLTTAQMMLRDRIVFSTLRAMKVPVAWNLAGGYQRPFSAVLDIHNNTMTAFKESFYA